MPLQLSSPAFENGARIPERFTCDGADVSPPLRWSGVPSGTRSLALLCDDPDAPGGVFHHWAMFNLPADQNEITEGYATEARVAELGPSVGLGVRTVRQGVNGFGHRGYRGPCPPRDHEPHRYHFHLLALDIDRLDLADAPACAAVAAAARPHVVEEAVLVGTYRG